ncbi:MAG: hypothetical protein KF817_04915 [Phycisphaeraceae bacterium]|nr:hypothetical protein [Phycisphaeraceae bacterium]
MLAGSPFDPEDPCAAADLTGDGYVGFVDLLELLANWTPGTSPCYRGDDQGSVAKCIAHVGWDPVALANCIEAMIINGTP